MPNKTMSNHKVQVIGLVGQIGSGKSLIADRIEQLYEAYIIKADEVGHWVMAPNGKAYQPVIDAFGSDILEVDGTINRQRLSDKVFNDPNALKELNAMIHREVFDYLETTVAYLKSQDYYDFVVIEAALLIVDAFMPIIDTLWYVKSQKAIRTRRLESHRDMDLERIAAIMSAQPEDAFYESHADLVITNDTSEAVLMEQVYGAIGNLRLYTHKKG